MKQSTDFLRPPVLAPLARQHGLSLIELMIALVIGLIFSLSVLLVQASLTRENVQMSDVTLRDNQARAALDLLTRDLSNAGFMLGGVQSRCSILLAYDSSLPAQQNFVQYPVSAASQPLALPTSTSPLPDGTPNPSAYGNANKQFTEMLLFTGTDTALQVPNNGNPATYAVQNTATQAAPTSTSTLPLGSNAGLSVGDAALLRMPLNGNVVCFRTPISNVGVNTAPSYPYINSKGTSLFPSSGYSAFNSPLRTAHILSAGTNLSDANFIQARLTDLGPSSAITQRTIAYYIGNYADASGGSYPVLVRAVLNSQTDALISANPVAAGVVSLQALFGVDETNSDGVTNYLTWPDVLQPNTCNNGASNCTAYVRSVLYALVTKTLHSDPKYNAPATIAIPSPAGAGNDAFTSYTVPTAYAQDRFSLIESEIAVRNQLWPH